MKATRKKKEKTHAMFFGIRTKLLGAFLIPVVLIVLLGKLSTQKASEVIIANYQDATQSTVQQIGEYYNILLQTVSAKSAELATNNEIRHYYEGIYAGNTAKEGDTYNQITGKTKEIVDSDANIGHVCVLAPYGRSATTVSSITADKYAEFMEMPEGKLVAEQKGEAVWSGYHRTIDESLMIKDSQYGVSVSRQIVGNSMQPIGVVIMDVSMEAIQKPICNLQLPEGSKSAFITVDGREITAEGENTEKEFFGQDFYNTAVQSTENTGLQEFEYAGQPYLYLYAKIGTTGNMMGALIPEAAITAQTAGIKNLTNMMVLIAIVIAVLVALILAAGIGNMMNKMNRLAKKAADGDLTVRTDTKRRDEFGALTRHLGAMLSGMKALIQRAAQVSASIFNASTAVANASGKMVETSKGISAVIGQMESGLEMQAQDARQCLDKMSLLEEKVEEVHHGAKQISQSMTATIQASAEGLHTVEELEQKAKETSEITSSVITDIDELDAKSQQISGIVVMINDIAEETNLLSLNASIEAARAGEHGRGFGVVAEEIGKLATASMNASKQIAGIIQEIQQMTGNTASTARDAGALLSAQEVILQNTVNAFNNITEHVEGLDSNMNDITNGIRDIRDAKSVTMEALENITTVLNEIAATAADVKLNTSYQVQASEDLNQEAEQLSMQSGELQSAISSFIIE
ncbi:MAG: methyl-accepting chemotaxis protein [Lachnospiraceae bacterium]